MKDEDPIINVQRWIWQRYGMPILYEIEDLLLAARDQEEVLKFLDSL